MELKNEFRVGVPVEQAWAVLTDVERIAPCLPGAELQEVEGDEYRGVVKVKVGPITAQYKGSATFTEQDAAAHRAVLRAEGRDTRGQGNAKATITAVLEPDGSGTQVSVTTDLTVTGRVAQFGRGVLSDVSAKLLGQFVECLETTVLAEPVGGAAAGAGNPQAGGGVSPGTATGTAAESALETTTLAPDEAPGEAPVTPVPDGNGSRAVAGPSVARRLDPAPAQPVDLLDAAGVPLAKRAVPLVAGVLVLLFLLRRRKRK